MLQIIASQWSKIELADREAYVQLLSNDAQTVWSNITSSKTVLQRYMEKHGYNCSEDELDGIYAALKPVSYNSPASDFDARIDTQLKKIAYNRNKVRIQKLWESQSGFESVAKWCDNYAVPIQWIVDDEWNRSNQIKYRVISCYDNTRGARQSGIFHDAINHSTYRAICVMNAF